MNVNLETNNQTTKNKIKKRFILLSAIMFIIGVIVFDKVHKYFSEEREKETNEQFEHVMEDVDSTILDIDDRLLYLHEREANDKHDIDSLQYLLQTEDSLNKEEKDKLLNEIKKLNNRRLEYTDEIVTLSGETRDSVAINIITIDVYDTLYMDTTIYNYNYIDSIIVNIDTIVKVDTVIIDDPKIVKKILKKHYK